LLVRGGGDCCPGKPCVHAKHTRCTRTERRTDNSVKNRFHSTVRRLRRRAAKIQANNRTKRQRDDGDGGAKGAGDSFHIAQMLERLRPVKKRRPAGTHSSPAKHPQSPCSTSLKPTFQLTVHTASRTARAGVKKRSRGDSRGETAVSSPSPSPGVAANVAHDGATTAAVSLSPNTLVPVPLVPPSSTRGHCTLLEVLLSSRLGQSPTTMQPSPHAPARQQPLPPERTSPYATARASPLRLHTPPLDVSRVAATAMLALASPQRKGAPAPSLRRAWHRRHAASPPSHVATHTGSGLAAPKMAHRSDSSVPCRLAIGRASSATARDVRCEVATDFGQ